MAPATPPNAAKSSNKWSAQQKPDSKRFVVPPTSEEYNAWAVDQLKLECIARKLLVVKNTKKEDRVAILNAYDDSKGAVNLLLDKQRLGKRSGATFDSDEARRTRHCMFRLINVLFSDEVFECFISSGNQLTRKTYDGFVTEHSLFHGICPDQITADTAAKLQSMWKDVHREFGKAEARNKVSGDHSLFWDYCRGDKSVMYLRLWCEHRGPGREFCAACVYEAGKDDSTNEGGDNSATKKNNRKRQKIVDLVIHLTEVLTKFIDADKTTKSDRIAEMTALARVQRERIERDHKAEKLATIDSILVRHRRALAVVEEQIHSRNASGMQIDQLMGEKVRLMSRISAEQEVVDKLEADIIEG